MDNNSEFNVLEERIQEQRWKKLGVHDVSDSRWLNGSKHFF